MANVLPIDIPSHLSPRHLFAAASPEFRLAALCCRSPADVSRTHQLNSALFEPINWSRLLHLTDRHRIAGLIHQALTGRADVPSGFRSAVAQRAGEIARNNLSSLSALKQLAGVLEPSGIRFAVLKGLPLARLAYGSLTARHSKDIDLLIAPEHMQAAEKRLTQLGFRRASLSAKLTAEQVMLWRRFRKHHEYVNPQNRVRVEVHWRPFDNPHLPSAELDSLQWVQVCNGFWLPTLAAHDLLLNLCVHGAGHAWFRLKWIADVAALLAQAEPGTAAALLQTARQSDLERPVEQALLLTKALFPCPESAHCAAPSRTSRWLAAIARDALLQEDTTSPSSESDFVARGSLRSRLLLRRGWRYRFAEARLHMASPADWQTLRMPARLQFLYPLLRLPLWIRRRWLTRPRTSP